MRVAPLESPPTAPVVAQSRDVRIEAIFALTSHLHKVRALFALDDRQIRYAVKHVMDQFKDNPALLANLQEMRDQGDVVFSHSVGVCSLSVVLAMDLDYSDDELKALAAGALLHDVGKMYVDDKIWQMPRRLTDEEFAQVRKHPGFGYQMLRRFPQVDERAARVAHEHHERYDGLGYPRGIKGEEIHPFARIVSVVDVFDALTSKRPYREAWSVERALALIYEESGRAFGQLEAEAFLRRATRGARPNRRYQRR